MSIVRVHYRERQRLSAADLRLEQDYRLGLGGRHDLAQHDWGIVRGLRIVARAGGGLLLTPGVAIDGYGREIFVPHPLAIDIGHLNRQFLWYVQLHYCEEAPQPCGNQPPPRIGPRPVVVVAGAYAEPTPSLDGLARARAAGIEGLGGWPVLIATLNFDVDAAGQPIDYALTRYAGQRAAAVRAPNARAVMQLGLSSRIDFYHFLLSTRDAAAVLDKRIGIDRHDTVHIWRPLCISASEAAASVDIGHKLLLHITAPMPAGIGSRVRIEGQVDAHLENLTTALRVAGIPSAASDAHTKLRRDSAALEFRDGRVGTVRLLDAKKGLPISFATGRSRVRKATAAAPAFSVQLDPFGAKLVLKNTVRSSTATETSPCDVARTRASSGESDLNALLFRPAQKIEADVLVREIHAVDISRPGDLAPATALRIAGGAADDTDAATRVSIGGTIAGVYRAALRMDGGRRIELLGTDSQAEPVLKVERTVYLPPIGAKDPLLPELLLLAYIGGLRRIGNVTTAVTVTLGAPVTPAGAILQGDPPKYSINIQPTPSSTTFTIKRVVELVTGLDGKGDLTFRLLELPPVPPTATTSAGTRNLALPELRRVEREVEVTVLLLVEVGQKVRVAVSNPRQITLPQP